VSCSLYPQLGAFNDFFFRIDRYIRAAQTSRNDLTKSNLHPTTEIPQITKSQQATYAGSPVVSMHTHPSTNNMADMNQAFSSLPPGAISGPLGPTQLARLNPSASAADMTNLPPQPTSPTSTKESGNFDRPSRTSSMTINPSVVSAPQPQGSAQWHQDGEALGLTRTTSSVNMDGEPRIFPGVVSNRSRRRSSMRISAVDEGAYPGYRKGPDTGNVVKERDADEEES
jgi:AMP deaminase